MSSSNWIVDLTLLILMLLSIATWSIVWIKFRAFRGEAQAAQHFLGKFNQERSWAARVHTIQTGHSDFAAVARAGLTTCRELQEEDGQIDLQEQQDILDRELRKLTQAINRCRERGLAELASIGSISPFVGLFGTVWGIMNALKTITATGQAGIDVVAGPIGEALIATAIGIATAVPAVMAYNYFLRQQRVHVSDLNGFNEDFLRHAMRHRSHWSDPC